jgi:hypothetical protein
MNDAEHFVVIEIPTLMWPDHLRIPTQYFRLLVAADTGNISSIQIAEFAGTAPRNGMVYCCSWGPDCERFHDIVDEVVAADEQSRRTVAGSAADDTVMTTWHANERLEDAVEFLTSDALPSNGYAVDCKSCVLLSVANPAWTKTIRDYLRKAGATIDLL